MLRKTGSQAIIVGISLLLTASASVAAETDQPQADGRKDFFKLHSPYLPGKYQAWRKYAQHSHPGDLSSIQSERPKAEQAQVKEALNTLADVKKPSETPSPKHRWSFWKKKEPVSAAPAPIAIKRTGQAAPVTAAKPAPKPYVVIQPVGAKQPAEVGTKNQVVRAVANEMELPPAKSTDWEPRQPAKIASADSTPKVPPKATSTVTTKPSRPEVKLPGPFPSQNRTKAAPIPEDVAAKYRSKWSS